jgi:hypothetical protein
VVVAFQSGKTYAHGKTEAIKAHKYRRSISFVAKLKRAEIQQADIEDYLKGQSDFAFETEVVRSVNSLGLQLEHGGTYDDPVTKKPRQFDIRASFSQGDVETRLQILMAIEAKNLQKNNPLVVHAIPRKTSESFHCVMGSWYREPKPHSIPGQHVFPQLASPSLHYGEGGACGKSMDQVHRLEHNNELESDDRDIYEKWAQAISSAHDLVAIAALSANRLKVKRCFSIVLPIVVVPDNVLWLVTYSTAGDRRKAEVTEQCSFYVNKVVNYSRGPWGVDYRISHIEIMTLNHLKTILGMVVSPIARGLAEWFPTELVSDMRSKHDRAE